MLEYRPEKDKHSSYFSIILLICGLILFSLSGYLEISPFIIQIISIAFIVFAIQVMQRYVLADFVYIIDDKDNGESLLNVIRVQGNKKITVCSVELENCVFAGDSDKFDKKLNNSFDYRQNFFNSGKFAIVYNDGGDNIMIKLETDEDFKKAINDRIAHE
ncbi:MAG: hypothetical protein IJ391_00300 [Clostridia bacterium]|nr:hypothetical protein [Clostridia bacterium]